ANHAHNDVLELWLNTGIAGMILAGVFVVWLILRAVEIWRRAPKNASKLDWTLSRAATMVVALLLVHSFFDYPLRTGAMMAVMAFAGVLLIEPPVTEPEGGQQLQASAKPIRHRQTRRLEVASPQEPTPLPPPTKAPALAAEQRWETDAAWPEEW